MESGLFNILSYNFFYPLAGPSKELYFDALMIIYKSYKSELSYGVDRNVLISKLSYYFESLDDEDIVVDEVQLSRDSRERASSILRNLKNYGWIEYEDTHNRMLKVIMPSYAVTIMQSLSGIIDKKEMEYQGEVSAIYSLLTNEELLNKPYPQVVKPVIERSEALFSGLKQLNTNIKKYISSITIDKPYEDLQNLLLYNDEIASKAYHRIKTSDNISKFRNTIINRLQNILNDDNLLNMVVLGYQNVENISNVEDAQVDVYTMIRDVIEQFRSYDDIIREIDYKHSKYISSSVERARFLALNSTNVESKLSSILQWLVEESDEEGDMNQKYSLFDVFSQGFVDGESFYTIPVTRAITDVDEISFVNALSVEERKNRAKAVTDKYRDTYSKKYISNFVGGLLAGKEYVLASDVCINSVQDMIKIIFIEFYRHDNKMNYSAIPTNETIYKNGFKFNNFKITRRVK